MTYEANYETTLTYEMVRDLVALSREHCGLTSRRVYPPESGHATENYLCRFYQEPQRSRLA